MCAEKFACVVEDVEERKVVDVVYSRWLRPNAIKRRLFWIKLFLIRIMSMMIMPQFLTSPNMIRAIRAERNLGVYHQRKCLRRLDVQDSMTM